MFVHAVIAAELTAIIMPFHRKQLKKLLFNFETWNTFVPSRLDSNYVQPELIIFASGKDRNDGLKEEILDYFELPKNRNLKQYFSTISVQFANLIANKDSYYRGTRTMFEIALSSGSTGLKPLLNDKSPLLVFKSEKISHVFYMEPDCVPIKDYWIDGVRSEIVDYDGVFWMKGSKYHGNPHLLEVGSDALRIHLNGNSIYNIGSEEFARFYFENVVPVYDGKTPYDLKIFEVLLMDDGKLMKDYGKYFVEAKFVQNTAGMFQNWRKYFSAHPSTFLNHLCDNWKEYIRYFNTKISSDRQLDINEQFKLQL